MKNLIFSFCTFGPALWQAQQAKLLPPTPGNKKQELTARIVVGFGEHSSEKPQPLEWLVAK